MAGGVSSSQAVVTPSRLKLTRFVQSASANFKDGRVSIRNNVSTYLHISTPLFSLFDTFYCACLVLIVLSILVLDTGVSVCAVFTRALLTFNPASLRIYPAPRTPTPSQDDISVIYPY